MTVTSEAAAARPQPDPTRGPTHRRDRELVRRAPAAIEELRRERGMRSELREPQVTVGTPGAVRIAACREWRVGIESRRW